MAGDHTLNVNRLLQCVNVLRVVTQQFAVTLHQFDKLVTDARLELARIDLFGELVERTLVFAKVVDVEHRLRIGQIGKINAQTCVDTVARSKVRYARRNADTGSG